MSYLPTSSSASVLTNPLTVDYPLASDGDLAVVVGPSRLQQYLVRFLYQTPGADPFDPTYGNKVLLRQGTPILSDNTQYAQDVLDSLALFKARMTQNLAAGTISPDEMPASFTVTAQINPTTATLSVFVTAYSVSGVQVQAAASLPLNSTPS